MFALNRANIQRKPLPLNLDAIYTRPLTQLYPQQTYYQYKPKPRRGEGKVDSPVFSSLSLPFSLFFDSCAESALFTTSAAASLQKEQRGPQLFIAATAAAADPLSHTDGVGGGGYLRVRDQAPTSRGSAQTRSPALSLSTSEVNIQKEKGDLFAE